jgi:hypothetical protein
MSEQKLSYPEKLAKDVEEAERAHSEARAHYDQAWEAVRDAAQALDKTALTLGRLRGSKIAFDAVARAAKEYSATINSLSAESGSNAEEAGADAADDAPRAADVVMKIVTERPGLRGVEIVGETEARGAPLKERTVRTALWRLKSARKIKNLDERWYLFDADPALADHSGEATDAAT